MTNLHTSIAKRRAQRGGVAPKRQAGIDALPIPKHSKYRNVATVIDNIRFASKLEAKRYGELKLLQRAGQINSLTVHSYWPMSVNGHHICDYQDDFSYIENGKHVVEDTKGVLTADCRIKLALMKAIHGIDVQLVKR